MTNFSSCISFCRILLFLGFSIMIYCEANRLHRRHQIPESDNFPSDCVTNACMNLTDFGQHFVFVQCIYECILTSDPNETNEKEWNENKTHKNVYKLIFIQHMGADIRLYSAHIVVFLFRCVLPRSWSYAAAATFRTDTIYYSDDDDTKKTQQ